MEPELERNRSGKHGVTGLRGRLGNEFEIQNETIKKGQLEGVLERRTFAQECSVFVGVVLLVMGFVGFVMDNFLGAHLSYSHNLIHLVSGSLLVWFGFKAEGLSRKFAIPIGSFYMVLGVLGFIVGTPGTATMGSQVRDASLWIISPEHLELGTNDHIIHLVLGGILVLGSLIKFRRLRREGF